MVPEKKVNIPIPGQAGQPAQMVEGNEVPIKESTERWTEVHLEDGSVLRVKPNVISVVRVTGRYGPDGNPMYALRTNQTIVVTSSPDHLRKPDQEPKVQ